MAFLIEKPREISKDHYLAKIDIDQSASSPGQFANIKIGDNDPLLRRPFSIHDHNGKIIEIIFKIVGRGTNLLKDNKAGYIDVIAPLGHGFSIPEKEKVLLIGGGVGNAPLYYLAKKLKASGNIIHYLYASRSKEYIYKKNEYGSISDEFLISTDDGTDGFKGLAGDIAVEILRKEKFDVIYTCGPAAMMKKIITVVSGYDIPVEISLENYFGCGIGLCYGCAVETTLGTKRACLDGPVFDGRIIKWDILLQ